MKNTFKNKIYRAFLFGFTLTLLASTIIVFGFSLPSIYSSTLHSEQETSNQTVARLDAYLRQINSLCTQISYTEDTRTTLSKKYDGNVEHSLEYIQDVNNLYQLYANFILPYDGVYGVFIYNLHGRPYYYCPVNQINRYYDFHKEEWYLELKEADRYENYVLSGAHQPPQLLGNNIFISLYRNIYDIMTFEIIGQAEIQIQPKALQKILEDSVKDDEKQQFTLVDTDGRVITSTSSYAPGDALGQDTIRRVSRAEQSFIYSLLGDTANYSRSAYSGWYLIYQYDSDILYKDIRIILITFVGFSLLAWVSMMVWGRILSRQVTTPLALLSDGVAHIQKKDFDYKITLNTGDEFEYLADIFNQMTDTLKKYIQHIYDVEKQNTEAQMSALQAQINPHFTLNTINSIKHMAMLQSQTNIAAMLDDFGLLLAATFRFPNELITLREEFNRIRAFSRVQNAATFGKIKIHFSYDEELLDFLTLGLILQPIIENAVFHGIKPKMSDHQMTSGDIQIQMSSEKDAVLIHVIDNGIGMPQERADALLSESHSGIGVQNVHTRIRLRFGEEYGLSIKSAPDQGCDVLIRIPKIAPKI